MADLDLACRKKIYVEDCGGTIDGNHNESAWDCFLNNVGWQKNDRLVAYIEVTFNLDAPKGHLPFSFIRVFGPYRDSWMVALFSLVRTCRV